MSKAARVEVEGADKLASTLRDAADDIDEPTRALDASARLVQTRARGGAPVDTGALSNSIEARRAGATVEVVAGMPYAPYQEYGTVNVPAHPYMRPALDYSETVIVGYFKADTDASLRKVKGA